MVRRLPTRHDRHRHRPIYDVYRIVSDRQQIPIGVLDAMGTRLWEWDGREPYGYQLPNQDKDGDSVPFYLNLRMPGQWFDSETGLYHNGFRDYDPQVGRYIQPDPIGLAGGWNEYAYVGSDPVEGVDPYGLHEDIIAIWDASYTKASLGHAWMGRQDGYTLLSQYPKGGAPSNPNVVLNWQHTVENSGRNPDHIFRISTSYEAGDILTKVADRERKKAFWDLWPGIETTNCSTAIRRSLYESGVLSDNPYDGVGDRFYSPNNLLMDLEMLSKIQGSGVVKIKSVPWEN